MHCNRPVLTCEQLPSFRCSIFHHPSIQAYCANCRFHPTAAGPNSICQTSPARSLLQIVQPLALLCQTHCPLQSDPFFFNSLPCQTDRFADPTAFSIRPLCRSHRFADPTAPFHLSARSIRPLPSIRPLHQSDHFVDPTAPSNPNAGRQIKLQRCSFVDTLEDKLQRCGLGPGVTVGSNA